MWLALPSGCLLLAVGVSAAPATDKRLMRSEKGGDEAGSRDSEMVTTGVSSRGTIMRLPEQDEQGAAELEAAQAHEASALMASGASEEERLKASSEAGLRETRESYDRLLWILGELRGQAKVVDGFEVPDITRQDRIVHRKLLQEEVDSRAKLAKDQNALTQADDRASLEEKAKQARATVYQGGAPVITGFWARDRPNEERIDPDNMKIYTFKTFRKRFPFKHTWVVEASWKKLPLAPKKVQRVKSESSEGGDAQASLIDENNRELVYQRDRNGYWHMGRQPPTEDDILKAARPLDFERRLRQRETAKLLEKYPQFHNFTGEMERYATMGKESPSKIRRQQARDALEHMALQMRRALGAPPEKKGITYVNVRGAEGYLCSFNAQVEKVSALQAKKQIEKLTSIPFEAVELYVQGQKFHDREKLSSKLVAGMGNWIDLQEKDWGVMKRALLKRDALNKARAARGKTRDDDPATRKPNPKAHSGHHEHHDHHAKGAKGAVPTPTSLLEMSSGQQRPDDDQDEEVRAAAADEKTTPEEEVEQVLSAPVEAEQKRHHSHHHHRHAGAISRRYLSEHPGEAAKTPEERMEEAEEAMRKEPYHQETKAERARRVAQEKREERVRGKAHKVHVLRKVVYDRAPDGKWSVAKEWIATPGHDLDTTKINVDEELDEGIPINARITGDSAKDEAPKDDVAEAQVEADAFIEIAQVAKPKAKSAVDAEARARAASAAKKAIAAAKKAPQPKKQAAKRQVLSAPKKQPPAKRQQVPLPTSSKALKMHMAGARLTSKPQGTSARQPNRPTKSAASKAAAPKPKRIVTAIDRRLKPTPLPAKPSFIQTRPRRGSRGKARR